MTKRTYNEIDEELQDLYFAEFGMKTKGKKELLEKKKKKLLLEMENL